MRAWTGAGVGGEYPLAATVTSESSSAASRGKLMAAVFAMQGVRTYVHSLNHSTDQSIVACFVL